MTWFISVLLKQDHLFPMANFELKKKKKPKYIFEIKIYFLLCDNYASKTNKI
jgi:hypothetical protein